MALSKALFPDHSAGYGMEQLASAFDLVMDPRDWQGPIRAVIHESDRRVIEKAVLWFTETIPAFETAPGAEGRLLVTADGYRLGTSGSLPKSTL